MSEVFYNNHEQTSSTEKQNNIPKVGIDDLNSTENYISIQAEKYKANNIGNEEWLTNLDDLINKQNTERQNLKDKISTGITLETKKELDVEKVIADIQKQMYEGLGINPEVGENSDPIKFVKGLVDGLVVENIDTVKTIIESGVDALIESLKGLLTIDGILAIIESLGEDISNIVNTLNNPYEGGVAIGGLGLGVLGKGMKGIKVISKTQKGEGKDKNSDLTSNETKVVENYTLNAPDNLYDNPEYAFLAQHKEFLGDIRVNDILGEGDNAIIVRHPEKSSLVVKIARNGKEDILREEFQAHKKFYDTLSEGKKEFPGKLGDEIKIPHIRKGLDENGGYFIMEKIEGQNLKSRFYIEKYNEKLGNKYDSDYLDGLSDNQVEELLKKEGLDTVPKILLPGDKWGEIMAKELKAFKDKHIYGTEVGNTLDFLEWKKLKHDDLHSGNIMITSDSKSTYIIDFGKVKIGE